MKLTKYNRLSPSLNNSFDRFFDDFFTAELPSLRFGLNQFNSPSVNVVESEQLFEIHLAAPGLNKEDFKIEVDNDTLTISSEVEVNRQDDQNSNYALREFGYSKFSRSFYLNDKIDQNRISANYENGILKVSLEKKEEAKPIPSRIIEIS